MGHGKTLFEQLSELAGAETVIVTIGNTLRGDDGAGPSVFHRLVRANVSAELIDAGTVPENYIQPIVRNAPHNLIIIDAVDFGAPAGTVRLFKTEQLGSFAWSTHTLSPHLFLDMVRSQLDVEVFFVGIQPERARLGQPLSPAVAEAVRQLCDTLAEIFPAAK